MDLLSVRDFERAAAERLTGMAYDYFASGARDEITLDENASAYRRIKLRYRVLRDVTECRLSVSLVGADLDLPILIAPTAFHRLACDEGELATARAARRTGALLILSTLATMDMETVIREAGGPVWFQVYVYRDRGATEALVRRAEAAGAAAIVLTVDAQVWGVRERDVRNRFALPDGLELPNLSGALAGVGGASEDSGLGAYVNELFDPSLSWADLEWLAGITDLPVLVKGIVHPEDGRLAVEHGAAGVIVSNHGGRQLDTSVATIDALPDVAEAVRAASPPGASQRVLVDGGIRRGTDILKAIACGADAVCIGRPILWGLAVEGEAGAARVLELLEAELRNAMQLCGLTTIEGVRAEGPQLLFRPPA